MQPYLFPYIGYFQLIKAVEHFVVLDDVTFIKRGWINRNRVLAEGEPLIFTVPVSGASSRVEIQRIEVSSPQYGRWRAKFLRTLDHNYHAAPHYDETLPLVEEALPPEAPHLIRDAAVESLRVVMRYLEVPFSHTYASDHGRPPGVTGSDRVLHLCRALGATCYYNAPGGKALYDHSRFAEAGIELRFVVPREITYTQSGSEFVPWLSIIDVLMWNRPDAVRAMLDDYVLE